MRILLQALAFAALALPALAQPASPRMSEAEGRQLFAAAGFRVAGGQALNRCGKAAAPKITFLDLNGDRAPEALVTDRNPACYGAGDYFSALSRDAEGRWRPVLSGVGRLKFETNRNGGWVDARVVTDCDRIWTFRGGAYVQEPGCAPLVSATLVGAGAKGPVGPGEKAAIMAAAGFKLKGGKWIGGAAECDASLDPADIGDLNGDGVAEAVVVENGSFCYGMTGQGIYLTTRIAPGQWRLLFHEAGIPVFRDARTGGWPDLQMGGPGFCQPLYRWNGKTYAFSRREEEQPGGCAGR